MLTFDAMILVGRNLPVLDISGPQILAKRLIYKTLAGNIRQLARCQELERMRQHLAVGSTRELDQTVS